MESRLGEGVTADGDPLAISGQVLVVPSLEQRRRRYVCIGCSRMSENAVQGCLISKK